MTDDRQDRRGAPQGSRGNVPHEVTDERRALVERLSGLQISQAEVAMAMGISPDTIQRHYAAEFAKGKSMKGIKLREHAYDFAFGVPNDPEDPKKGWKIAPDPKMVTFLLERQFGMIQQTKSELSLTEITPEAAAWLGRSTS